MNGLIGLFKDKFSVFLEAILFIPSALQIWHVSEVVVLVFILVLALSAVFLCARLMAKYSLGFTAGVWLAFSIMSLILGLIGCFLSIPQLYARSTVDTFMVVCMGSPVFTLFLGVLTSLGSRVRNNYPKAGMLLLYGAGFLFAWVLLTTFILFALRLYN